MKFSAFKEFRGGVSQAMEKFLRVDLTKTLRELAVGLTRLKFTENFEAFKTEVTIANATEVAIRNQLRSGAIPTAKIIVRGQTDANNVVDGDTEWTKDFVYLKNNGSASTTVTVIFFR